MRLYENDREDLIEDLIRSLNADLMGAVSKFQSKHPDIDVYDLVDMVQDSVEDLENKLSKQPAPKPEYPEIDYRKYIVNELKEIWWVYEINRKGLKDFLTQTFDFSNCSTLCSEAAGKYNHVGAFPARKVTLKGKFFVVPKNECAWNKDTYGQKNYENFHSILDEVDLSFEDSPFYGVKLLYRKENKEKIANVQVIEEEGTSFNIKEISSLHKYSGSIKNNGIYYLLMPEVDSYLGKPKLKQYFPSSVYKNYAIAFKAEVQEWSWGEKNMINLDKTSYLDLSTAGVGEAVQIDLRPGIYWSYLGYDYLIFESNASSDSVRSFDFLSNMNIFVE